MTATADAPKTGARTDTPQTDASHGGRRILIGLALSIVSGGLAALSFDPVHCWPLIWIAFVPALLAQYHFLPHRWSGLGLGIAIGSMFEAYLGPGLADAKLAWPLYAYGFWIALLVWLVSGRSRGFHERTGYRFWLLSVPMAWVALDFVRTTLTEVFGGTWGMVAYAMYDRPAFLQPVSVFGIHGMNLLILLVNWGIAGLVLARLQRRVRPESGAVIPVRRSIVWAAAVAVLVLAWAGSSLAMLRHPAPAVRVAAVEPGSWRSGMAHDIPAAEELARDVAMTNEASVQGAQLVVWREAGLKFDPRGPKGAVIADLARKDRVYIAAGWSAVEDGKHYNEVATFAPDGQLLGSYGKSHPGTFAGDYSDNRGHYLVYTAPFARFGSIICFDLDFTDSARNVAKRGAQLLAVSSNDVPGIADKHYTHLVFRAIETRLSAMKADSAFDSAAIDPYGRILKRHVTASGSAYLLVADMPLGSGHSVYVSLGDWLGWLAVGVTMGFMALSLVLRLRRRGVLS